tara:strand:- start:193 stop:711 length:519 start_codon:yes stop_codon:yes gene_type:complete
MTYLAKLYPDLKVGTISLDTSGVTISQASPKVTITSIDWGTATSGAATISSNNIVLAANKKYILQATLSSSTGFDLAKWESDRKFRWYDETNSGWLGKLGVQADYYEAYSGYEMFRCDEAARAIVINGNSTRSVSLKYSGTTNQSYTVGDKYTTGTFAASTAYGRLEIWEIG